MNRLFTIVLSLFLTLPLLGQEQFLKSFTATQQKQDVRLDWTIIGGNQCSGTNIFHSADGINWRRVGQIGGVCGSTDSDVSYSFLHEEPLMSARNYYKIELPGLGESNIIYIDHYYTDKKGYLVLDKQDEGSVSIYFDNHFRHKSVIELFDLSGQMHYSDVTNGKIFTFSTANLPKGLVIFRIYDEKSTFLFTGKILIK